MSLPGLENFFSARHKGQLIVGPYGQNSLNSMGHWETPNLVINQEKASIPDNISPSGGQAETLPSIAGLSLSFVCYNWNQDTIQKMLKSTVVVDDGTTPVASEVVTVHASTKNYIARTDKPIATITSVTGVGGTPSYTVNDDYRLELGQLIIIAGGAIEAAADAELDPADQLDIEVSYNPVAGETHQGAISLDEEFSVRCILQNTAQANKIQVVDFWRVTFDFPDGIPMVQSNTEYLKFNATMNVLADSSRPAGNSSYFQLFKQTA